ncbi:hypothetical protein J6590_064266 [Homalodisca vitripennis]|nr:hypothetical protein J6590_064266 [Homalodisca vitripennis]
MRPRIGRRPKVQRPLIPRIDRRPKVQRTTDTESSPEDEDSEYRCNRDQTRSRELSVPLRPRTDSRLGIQPNYCARDLIGSRRFSVPLIPRSDRRPIVSVPMRPRIDRRPNIQRTTVPDKLIGGQGFVVPSATKHRQEADSQRTNATKNSHDFECSAYLCDRELNKGRGSRVPLRPITPWMDSRTIAPISLVEGGGWTGVGFCVGEER